MSVPNTAASKNQKNKIPMLSSLVFWATAGVFTTTLIVMAVGGFFISKKLQGFAFESLMREAKTASALTADAVSDDLWNIDEDTAKWHLDSLKANPVFCGIRLIDEQGQLFASSGFPETLEADQSIIYDPIKFDNPTDDIDAPVGIGTQESCVTMAPLKAEILKVLQYLISAFCLLSIAILLSSHFSLQILMVPLRHFKGAMSAFLNNMKPISDPKLLKQNEVGDLVQSFNILAISLSETYRALKKAKEETEASYKVKTDFFANMSHELRTPLNSIIGMTQLLYGTNLDTDQREMFDSISRSSDNLLKIVNDILDVSKIESRQVHLERIAFDAIRVVRHCVRGLMPLASQKGLELTFEAIGTSFLVFGDPTRFDRVLINIISNALRYTEKGSVKVYVRVLKIRDNRANVTVEVEDTGIGIPQDKIHKIFEKFTQADNSTTRKYGGTGLGLTITRELVQLMGGDIYVTSEVGKGSIFSVTVPFEIASAEDMPPEKAKQEQGFEDGVACQVFGLAPAVVRVLMAEDHVMNQLFMKKLLRNLGIVNFTLVENGKEAVKEITEGVYDIVLMDCHMPEMNGYDATKAIRALPDENKRNVPIIAMTANAMPEDEKLCLSYGMTGYISKPVDIGVFKKVLGPWINFSKVEGKPAAPAPAVADAPKLPLYNLDNLRANSMGDITFERELIALFVSQAKAQLEELKTMATEGLNIHWVEVAHALKGTSGSVGAEGMQALCAEAQAMAEASAEARAAKVAAIENAYAQVKAALIAGGHYKET